MNTHKAYSHTHITSQEKWGILNGVDIRLWYFTHSSSKNSNKIVSTDNICPEGSTGEFTRGSTCEQQYGGEIYKGQRKKEP